MTQDVVFWTLTEVRQKTDCSNMKSGLVRSLEVRVFLYPAGFSVLDNQETNHAFEKH